MDKPVWEVTQVFYPAVKDVPQDLVLKYNRKSREIHFNNQCQDLLNTGWELTGYSTYYSGGFGANDPVAHFRRLKMQVEIIRLPEDRPAPRPRRGFFGLGTMTKSKKG